MGVFNRIFAGLAAEGGPPDQLMIDVTHLKAHRTVASLLKKRLCPDGSGSGLNSKPHAVCDDRGRPRVMLLTEGQLSDYKGRGPHVRGDAARAGVARRSRLRRRLVPSGACRPWNRCLASRHARAARRRSRTMPLSTVVDTGSRTCSVASKTGSASTPATTDAHTLSCAPTKQVAPVIVWINL